MKKQPPAPPPTLSAYPPQKTVRRPNPASVVQITPSDEKTSKRPRTLTTLYQQTKTIQIQIDPNPKNKIIQTLRTQSANILRKTTTIQDNEKPQTQSLENRRKSKTQTKNQVVVVQKSKIRKT